MGMVRVFALALTVMLAVAAGAQTAAEPTEPKVKWEATFGEIWKQPAPASRGMILLMPLQSDDAKDAPDGARMTDGIEDHLRTFAPDGLGFSRVRQLAPLLREMLSDHGTAKTPQPSEADIAALKKFYAATAVFGGTVQKEKKNLVLQCTLTDAKGLHEKRIEVPENYDLDAMQQAARWIVEVIGLAEEEQKFFAEKIFGPDAHSLRDWQLNFEGSDESKRQSFRILAGFLQGSHAYYRTGPLLQYNMILSAHAPGDLKEGDAFRVSPELFKMEEFASLHLASAYWLIWKGETVAGRQELCRYLARQPCDAAALFLLRDKAYPEGERRDEFLSNLQSWYDRAPDSAWRDWMMGEMLHRSAWDYRGPGYANTVTEEGSKYFHNLKMLSVQYLDTAEKKAGPLPMIATTQIDNYGCLGEQEKMYAMHERCVRLYPSAPSPWHTVLHFTRPRWGGDIKTAMALIDGALDRGGLDTSFVQVPMNFHFQEATTQFPDLTPRVAIRRYLNQHPGSREQITRATHLLIQTKDAERCATAASICFVTKDNDAIRDAIRANPRLVFEPESSFFPGTYEVFSTYPALLLLQTEQWDIAAEFAVKKGAEDHPWATPEQFAASPPYKETDFSSYYEMILTVVRVMENRRDPNNGKSMAAALRYWRGSYEIEATGLFVHVLINKGTPNLENTKRRVDEMESKVRAKGSDDGVRIIAATRALLAFQAGDKAKAEEELKKVEPTRPMEMDWVRREVCLAILGSVPEVAKAAAVNEAD